MIGNEGGTSAPKSAASQIVDPLYSKLRNILSVYRSYIYRSYKYIYSSFLSIITWLALRFASRACRRLVRRAVACGLSILLLVHYSCSPAAAALAYVYTDACTIHQTYRRATPAPRPHPLNITFTSSTVHRCSTHARTQHSSMRRTNSPVFIHN